MLRRTALKGAANGRVGVCPATFMIEVESSSLTGSEEFDLRSMTKKGCFVLFGKDDLSKE